MTEREALRRMFNACAAAVGGDATEGWQERLTAVVQDEPETESEFTLRDLDRMIAERDERVLNMMLEGAQLFINLLEGADFRPAAPP